MRPQFLARLGAATAIAALLAACGGGGVNTAPVAQPTAPAQANVASSTTAPTVLPALAANGVSSTGKLGTASVATTIAAALSIAPPTGVPALSVDRAAGESLRTAADTSADAPVAYLSFGAPVTVTLAAGSSLTFTVPSATGVVYYLAMYTSTGWVTPFAGPGTVNGSQVTISSLPAFTIAAGTEATFALYTTAAVAPTPTPTPVPTPVLSQSTVAFDVSASPSPVAINVSESNYTGNFTPSALNCTESPANQATPSANAFVATISPASTPAKAFTVSPGLETGTCTVTFSDGTNSSPALTITTSGSNLNLSSSSRN